jgi:hypothetical protein
MRIRMQWGRGILHGTLRDTPTARALYDALPCTSDASTWGKEVYFPVPVRASLEPDACDVVAPGTICYWVQGQSVALPYGPTPISKGNECRLVAAVNVLGVIDGEPGLLATVREGEEILVERVEG